MCYTCIFVKMCDQLIANMLRKIATLLKSGRVDVKRREKIIHKVEMLLGDSHTRSKSYRDIQRKVDEKRNGQVLLLTVKSMGI